MSVQGRRKGPRLTGALAAALLASLGMASAAGCRAGTVTRSYGGKYVEERAISAYAYTLYAHAADFEAHGQLEHAAAYFEAAADEDPESPEIWTRIGAIRCRSGIGDAPAAFDRAESLDPELAPLWHERARCALHVGDARSAVAFARRATANDPANIELTITLARALDRAGQPAEAYATLQELTLRVPHSQLAWAARAELAGRLDRASHQAFARDKVGPHAGAFVGGTVPSVTETAPSKALAVVDAALLEGDLERAQHAATRARLAAGDLACRAALLGRAELAALQARLVLRADPHNPAAEVAELAASVLLGDDDALVAASMRARPDPARPALSVHAELTLAMCVRMRAHVNVPVRDGALEASDWADDPVLRDAAARSAGGAL